MNWIPIQEKYRNSVFQLICLRGIYDPFRPYINPSDKWVRGTGFIVDIERGVIVTNAHVVANTFSIIGRTPLLGKRDLQLDLLSICRDRDLALVLIRPSDRKLLLSRSSAARNVRDFPPLVGKSLIERAPGSLNMPLGDSMALQQTDEILTIGYPLGQENIKFTTGIISGFQARIDENNPIERDEDHPSYLQITAPLNGGNSGGPLLNTQGQVIGINAAGIFFSQNVGYAIGSRTLLAIYPRMMANYSGFEKSNEKSSFPDIVRLPKMSFNWNRTNPDLIKKLGIPGSRAIYISKIFPDSVFYLMASRDLLSSLSYSDPYWNYNPESYDLTRYLDQKNSEEINLRFDDYGDLEVNQPCGSLFQKNRDPNLFQKNQGLCRNLDLKELYDLIPLETNLKALITRDHQSYYIKSEYFPVETYVTSFIYPRFEPPDYEIFAGICLSTLTLNHVERDVNLLPYIKGKKRYRSHLIVNQIFPETSINQMNVFKEGSILNKLQGEEVQTLDQVREILSTLKREEILTLEDKKGGFFALQVEKAIQEDLRLLEKFKISQPYIFSDLVND